MYQLTAYKAANLPAEKVSVALACDVAAKLLMVLDRHPNCERVIAEIGGTFLFAVDGVVRAIFPVCASRLRCPGFWATERARTRRG